MTIVARALIIPTRLLVSILRVPTSGRQAREPALTPYLVGMRHLPPLLLTVTKEDKWRVTTTQRHQ